MSQHPAKSHVPRISSHRIFYEPVKRVIDLSVASFALVVLSPVFLTVALVIRSESRGPVFFRQERVGRDGQNFVMVKFRTMIHDSDDSRHRDFMKRHVQGESQARLNKEGAEVFLLKDDRVTRVGEFLRRTSLDELPNLLNVLEGSMSMVGPRPPISYEVAYYDDRAKQRLVVKPGMTGYSQVRGRGTLTFDDMVNYDLEYIADRSLWTDLKIVLETIPAVMRKRGV